MKAKKFAPRVDVGDRAIVVGGSIAGLLSARVLADSFAEGTITEIDKLPEKPEARKGVPQSVQPHVLFAKGYRLLEELFPGIGAELSIAGALTIDWAREFHHFTRGGWTASADPSEVVSFTCSRPLLEWAIRQRLSGFSNVRFVEQHRVTGLVCNPDKTHITGVRLRSIGDATEGELQASLVVDASGRRSFAPQWLENLGFTSPSETVVNPFLSSRLEGNVDIPLASKRNSTRLFG